MRSKKAIINIITSLLLQIVMVICGFIVPRLIIKTFGSSVNGLVASITQFLAYITLLESGFGPVVKSVLYKPIAQKNKKEIEDILKSSEKFFRTIAYIFLMYLLILSFIYPLIVNTEFSFWYTMSLVLIISLSTLAEYYFGMTYKLYLQAEQKTYITSAIQIVGVILNTIAVVILVKMNCSIHIVKLASSFIFVLRPILQAIYVKRKYNIDLKDADDKYKLKQKWDGLAQHIASVVHNNTDIAILTIFMPITEVSIYSVYYLVVNGIRSLIQSFTSGIDASFGDMVAKNEKEQLNKSFNTYELFYFTVATIGYTCTMILIIPFVKVYTFGITDINYIKPLFGFLLILGEFVWAIRLPYNDLIKATGHFKETRKGAWVEAIVNIVISIILVWNFGIVGVAIGTLVAMMIRTIEFNYHTSKYILERNIFNGMRKPIISLIQALGLYYILKNISFVIIDSYIPLILEALIVFIICSIFIIMTNCILYRDEVKNLKKYIIRFIKKRE